MLKWKMWTMCKIRMVTSAERWNLQKKPNGNTRNEEHSKQR